MGKGRKKKQSGAKRDRGFSTLEAHKRHGTKLTPPLMTIPQMSLASWMNDRLPEMVWGALLHEHVGRANTLQAFRVFATLVHEAGEEAKTADATLTAIAELPTTVRQRVLNHLCEPVAIREALRPLLLFAELPGRIEWFAAIRAEPDLGNDWERLGRAVALVTDHQSQEATDLRWLRVITIVATGRFHLPETMKELGAEIEGYPNVGDMRKVRPTIRSLEGGLGSPKEAGGTGACWSQAFWDTCLRATVCKPLALSTRRIDNVPQLGATLAGVRGVALELQRHSALMSITTAVDARHEATFGLAAYCLATLEELLHIGNGTGILSRAGLRTILEASVTLAYLAHKDDRATWQIYRSYGAGQAKLAFLKIDELTEMAADDLPPSADLNLLELLANEDRWQDFVEINLGHWDASNLRAISTESNRKAQYDRYYGWTSSFVHGNWAAVRAMNYDICANPLHRWHRVLRATSLTLSDIIVDSAVLVDDALGVVHQLYPPFTPRVGNPNGQ